jgi:hypothetical protein
MASPPHEEKKKEEKKEGGENFKDVGFYGPCRGAWSLEGGMGGACGWR